MAKKKINLLFDATHLAIGIDKSASRSGIYFVTYNLCLQLIKREDINLYFYCHLNKYAQYMRFVKQYPVFSQYSKVVNLPEVPLVSSSQILPLDNLSCFKGFNFAEKQGIWSSEYSEIIFRVDDCYATYEIQCNIGTFFSSVTGFKIINGKGDKVFISYSGKQSSFPHNLNFILSESDIDNGEVRLKIFVDGAKSPNVLGINEDKRILGLFFHNVKVIKNKEQIQNKKNKFTLSDLIYLINERRIKAKNCHNYVLKKIYSLSLSFFKFILCVKNKCVLRKTWQNKIKIDAFVSPMNAVPEDVLLLKCKKYVILYDIIPLKLKEYWGTNPCSWFDILIKSLNTKDGYFAISEYTKQDFLKEFRFLRSEQISVLPLACSERFQVTKLSPAIRRKYEIPIGKKYIFSLCTLEPRKNLLRAIRCFMEFVHKYNIQDMIYVLGGGKWNHFLPIVEKELSVYNDYQEKIKWIGYVDDEDLPALYSGAEWFVYTSQYEGFGLPPLEAMACGCPVITSNNSSLPEVVGDAGIMIDWDSNEQHIKAYEKYYNNSSLRTKNLKKGIIQAQKFTWSKTINIMIERIKNEC